MAIRIDVHKKVNDHTERTNGNTNVIESCLSGHLSLDTKPAESRICPTKYQAHQIVYGLANTDAKHLNGRDCLQVGCWPEKSAEHWQSIELGEALGEVNDYTGTPKAQCNQKLEEHAIACFVVFDRKVEDTKEADGYGHASIADN